MAAQDSDQPVKFKTCRRCNDVGHAHALTFSCFQRRPFLTSERSCRRLAEAIAAASCKHKFLIWAYVFMPEHVHLVVCPQTATYSISKFLASLKLPVTRKAIAHVTAHAPEFVRQMADATSLGGHHLRFWQRGGGFDRNIWSERVLLKEIEYLHANPVKRGLSRRPEDWRWSSAGDYLGAGQGPLELDLQSLPRFFETEQ
ncbi:MAG TPA: transposase [Lacipirellulaceae bacterium]|nr:transposase [Lacipirellulaceae bacterium]